MPVDRQRPTKPRHVVQQPPNQVFSVCLAQVQKLGKEEGCVHYLKRQLKQRGGSAGFVSLRRPGAISYCLIVTDACIVAKPRLFK